MSDRPTVFIVDDDSSVLRGIERVLRSHGFHVQPFASPWTFLAAIEPDAPGCVLLDLSMPEIGGLELQERLAEGGFLHPVVFLTGYGTVQAGVRAMKAGAMDFIEKPCEAELLVATVRKAIDADRQLRTKQAESHAISQRLASLTPRESQVMRHVIAGRLNKQIAARLGTAEKTVKVHRARVMHKMSVKSVAELTRLAEFVGLAPEM